MNEQEFKKIVRQSFDEAATGYDKPAMRFFDKSAEHLVGQLDFKGAESLLDLATGTGKVALAAAKRLGPGKVLGIDLSEGMLERAREKAREQNLTNISFERRDVDELQLLSESFDCVCSSFGVFFWSDMEKTLRHVLPCLKPGGTFAMTSFADGSFCPQSELCLERFKKYGVKLPDSYSWQRLDRPQKHFDLLNNVGLKQIASHAAPMGYYLQDAAEWWDLVCYTGFRSFLNQLTAEQAEQYRREHLEEIQKTSGPQGILLKVEVIFTTARK